MPDNMFALGEVASLEAGALASQYPCGIVQDDADTIGDALVAIAGGDTERFSALFLYLAPRLKSYLLGMRAPSAICDELCQEIMLTIWRKADRFEPWRGSGAAWVFTIARNRWIDSIRREQHPDALECFANDSEIDSVSPEDVCLLREQQVRVLQAFGDLSPMQETVVSRCMLRPEKLSAVANELNLPLGTAKSHLRRAIARLRCALDEFQ